MPKRKYNYGKRSTKRRRTRGRRTFKARRKFVSRGVPSGMPTIRTAKLRYSDTHAVTSTSGILSETIYRANSCYDPWASGTGHQPMGFDQWATLFQHYVVLGSKISLKVINDGSTPGTTENLITGCYLSDGKTLSYSTANEYIEARKGTYRLINGESPKTQTMYNKFSAKRFFNVKDVKDNITRLGAQVTTNPTEEAFYHIWVDGTAATTDNILVQVVVDYIVQFSEPKDLAQS